MDPVSITALVVSIISALGVAVLGICKVIKKSSCFWHCIDVETKENQ